MPEVPVDGADPASGSLDMKPAAALFSRSQLGVANVRWLRGRPLVLRFYLLLVVFFTICLWLAGYPAWRVYLVAGLVAVLAGVLSWISTMDSPRHHTWLLVGGVLLLLAGAMVTGGFHSPLLVTPVFLVVLGASSGWSREAKGGLALVGLAVLATPFLGPVVGPPVPEPYHAIFAVGFTLTSLAAVMDHVAALAGHVLANTRELFKARERMANQALSRTRELELLSSRLSHELKNPLGAIKALVQLSARSNSVAEVRERLAVVEGEIERMDGILREYLTFAKPLERVHVEKTELGTVVDDVFEVLEGRAREAGVVLLREGEVEAPVDPRRLKEAVLNLVANAIEASGPGKEIRVGLSRRQGRAVLSVRDQGAGMPAHVLERLGTPFFTTRENGNGLGVLLARRAFEQHGGTLTYDSEPGRGTTATATLPLAAPAPEEGAAAASAPGDDGSGGARWASGTWSGPGPGPGPERR